VEIRKKEDACVHLEIQRNRHKGHMGFEVGFERIREYVVGLLLRISKIAGAETLMNKKCSVKTGKEEVQEKMRSSNKSTEVQLTVPLGFLVLFLGECVPKSECFVAGTCDDGLSIRAHGQIEYTVCVTGQGGDHI